MSTIANLARSGIGLLSDVGGGAIKAAGKAATGLFGMFMKIFALGDPDAKELIAGAAEIGDSAAEGVGNIAGQIVRAAGNTGIDLAQNIGHGLPEVVRRAGDPGRAV